MLRLNLKGLWKEGSNSACTLGILIQSIITRALDESNYVLMPSLDLSTTFEIVNTKLLVKWLKIIGLAKDVINLIKVWLEGCSSYVTINNQNSILLDLICSTVQGSILGPILYSIYVSPLLDIEGM
jgi:hypothetical protein